MSLQTRLEALVAAIGADIKALQASSGGTKDVHGVATADQTLASSTTVVTGSKITIPTGKIKVGSKYRVTMYVSKTGAATAAPVVHVRVGTLGTTGDSARHTFNTFPAQTAVIDEGVIEVECTFTVAGTVAVMKSFARLTHRLAATGFSTANAPVVTGTSAAFDATVAALIMSVSIDPGASSVWTVTAVSAELVNLAP